MVHDCALCEQEAARAEAGLEQEDWVGADVSKNVVSCVGGWRGEG